MKIGPLMGSFDPITIGHVAIANILIANNVVDKVVLILSKSLGTHFHADLEKNNYV